MNNTKTTEKKQSTFLLHSISIFYNTVSSKKAQAMDEANPCQRTNFWAKERWKLKSDIDAVTNVHVEDAKVVKGFCICKGTSITIVSVNPLTKQYIFTIDILQNVLINADNKSQLFFRVEADILDIQKVSPQIIIFAEN